MEGPIAPHLDQRNYHVSGEKFWSAGFKSKVTLEDGVRELIKGYRTITNSRYGNV